MKGGQQRRLRKLLKRLNFWKKTNQTPLEPPAKQIDQKFPQNYNRDVYIFFSKKFDLCYFPVAKSASSGLRPWMYSLDDFPYHDENALYGDRTILLPVREYRFQFASSFLFTCVRNPFSRLISSYLDKFVYSVFQDGKRIPPKGSSVKAFRGNIANFTAVEKYAQDTFGVLPESGLTFEEFLKAIRPEWPPDKRSHGLRCDPHWASQFDLIALPQLGYDAVLKCESLFTELKELQNLWGIPENKRFRSWKNKTRDHELPKVAEIGYLGDVSAAELSRTGFAKQALDENFYQRETLALVRKLFRKDIAVFDYQAPRIKDQ